MVDFVGNPYLNDPRFQLSDDQMRQYRLGSIGSALTAFGAGIAQSGAQGQPWMAGIAPGAAAASGALSQQEAQLAHMQEAAAKYQQMEDYRKAQEKEIALKSGQLEMDQELQRKLMAGGIPGLGGFNPNAGPNMGPGGGNPAAAIGGMESGNNYGAVGPVANPAGNRAYGKYQVLDSNIPTWTKEVLGKSLTPQEFLADPQAQDAVFKAKFGQYSQKYGPEGAARAWFAGEGGMNNPNAKDVLGTSVAGYGQRFTANGGAAPQVAQAGGPPVIPQGGDAPQGQPGTLPQPPQMAPQMPPGMPGPPPDQSGMLPYMMSPRLAPLVTGAMGQQKQQYEYQWKAYQAAQDAEKQRLANENAKVKIGPDGQPVPNSMLMQTEASTTGANERAKLQPDIVAGQATAAGQKAAAEETAKAQARIQEYFPKNYQNMKPEEIRAHMAQNNPLQLGELDAIGRMDVAPSELSNRPSGSMGLTKQETIAAVKVLYPDYSVRTAENHKDFIDYMRPNEQGGKTAASISNAAQHITDAADAFNQLKNGKFPEGNKLFNEWATKFGWDKLTPYQTIQQAIGPEIAKVISSGSDNGIGEREAATELLKAWNNPKTAAGVWDRVAGLMEKRRNTLYNQAEKAAVPREFVDQSIGQYGTDALANLRSAIKVPDEKVAPQSAVEPPPQAVKALQMSPNRAAEFDAKFGPGSAAKVLGR